jgi:TrmH family RNA methyltransferase
VQDGSLIPTFGRARRDEALAVLEGFHAVKHALRFGAEMLELVCVDVDQLRGLVARLAPDLGGRIEELARQVPGEVFAKLAPFAPATGVIGLARRPAVDVGAMLRDAREAPLIALEEPRDLGNAGACVRVAAAADAAGVLSTGNQDPWHPDALRGAAGLHFALPVARAGALVDLAAGERPLIAVDPDGEELSPALLPARAVLVFGSERRGISEEVLAGAQERLRIPMRAGVSSLNLATSVAAVLFAWRLAAVPGA